MHFLEWLHRIFVPSHRNAYRPHLLRRRSLMFLLGLMLVAEGALVLNILVRQSGHDFLAAVIQSEILNLTNAERAQNAAGALQENPLLDASAQAKANDMAAKGYFAHNSPDGTTPWGWIKETGYDYQYAGENLAVRFVDSQEVVVAWMASPTHRANILKSSYTEIGVGIAEGMYQGQPATYVVQHFGKPMARAAATAKPAATAEVTPPKETQVLGAETIPTPAPQEIVPEPEPVLPVVEPVVAVAPAPTASFDDSLARQLGRMLSEPRAATGWVLGGIVALLVLALAFAFVHHLQVQAHDLLLPGVVVAGIALTLLLVNSRFLLQFPGEAQPAGVVLYESGVVIDSAAASDEK